MIRIIHKTDFKIKTFINEQAATQIKCAEYALISDSLIDEIEAQKYKDGTYFDENGQEKDNLIDLGFIKSLNISETGNRFDEVLSVEFKSDEEKDLLIESYENDKMNRLFKDKNYKVISTLPWLMNTYPFIYALCKENDNIITESESIGEDNLKVIAYMDNVSDFMKSIILQNPENMELVPNPTKTLEIIV